VAFEGVEIMNPTSTRIDPADPDTILMEIEPDIRPPKYEGQWKCDYCGKIANSKTCPECGEVRPKRK
jgi:hypothetical protein